MSLNLASYRKLSTISTSISSSVYKVIDSADNDKVYAVKKTKIEGTKGVSQETIREIATLKSISHPNILSVKQIIIREGYIYLVSQYCASNLREKMQKNTILIEEVKSYMLQLLKGLVYCHSHGIVHLNLCPEHILITDDNTIKICSFSKSKPSPSAKNIYINYGTDISSIHYRAPEQLLLVQDVTSSVDIWSLGCIFAEMILGRILCNGINEIDQLFKIFSLLGTPDDGIWHGVTDTPGWSTLFPVYVPSSTPLLPVMYPEANDLVNNMLIYDPTQRIKADQCLQHPYFK